MSLDPPATNRLRRPAHAELRILSHAKPQSRRALTQRGALCAFAPLRGTPTRGYGLSHAKPQSRRALTQRGALCAFAPLRGTPPRGYGLSHAKPQSRRALARDRGHRFCEARARMRRSTARLYSASSTPSSRACVSRRSASAKSPRCMASTPRAWKASGASPALAR